MHIKNLAVLVALPLALVACSGGGSGSSGGSGIVAPGASISSQFIDAPVKGLKVEKTSGNGETGANGVFSCKSGEALTFWLKEIGASGKGIALGNAFCGSHIYIDDLGANAGKAGALIQSLSTGTGTRTELDLSAFNATNYDLKAEVSDVTVVNDGLITSLIADVVADTNIEVAPVTVADARKHIDSHLPAQNDATLESIADVEHTLKLIPLATNPEDYCWENIQVKVNLETIARGDSEGVAYRFNVNQYLAWDGDSEQVPTPTICNGQEQNSGSGNYQCLNEPVSKIMTGRSVSGAKFEEYSFEIPQNAVAICQHDEGFEFNYTNGVNCVNGEETPIQAANALKLDVSQGWNFNITVTDSNYTVNFTENAVDIGAVLNADNKATAYTQTKFNCSYALVEELDPGSSLAE